MAPEAKVTFFDIGVTGNSDLTLPNNIYTDMFYPMYLQGARIFSNSWGNNAYVI
jgi:hypothetical protein